MSIRLVAIVASAMVVVAAFGCSDDGPEPVFVGGEGGDGDGDGDADGDGDGDSDGDGDGDNCTGEDYPCGPYGNTNCEVVEDHAWIPVNEAAYELAGEDGLLTLSDIYADESIVGLLLFGTAGWCTFCEREATWLNEVYADFENVDGRGSRVEMIAVVFETNTPGVPADADFAEAYASRKGFPFPAVADMRGQVLNYFDSEGAPGNILIDTTTMEIFNVVSGFDQGAINGSLHQLDGSVTCH